MRKAELLLFLLNCCFFPETVSSQFCPSVPHSSDYGVTWPTTQTKTASRPPCVGKSKEFLFRQCINGVWGPEPDCDYVQPTTQPQCPESFTETDNICYQLSPKSPFPPVCPFEDVLPFHSYINEVRELKPIWLPVQRDLSNGLGLLQWVEASSMYKMYVDDAYYVYSGKMRGKDCLLYYNSSYIEAISCKEEHFGICAYSKFKDLSHNMCANNFFSDCRRSDFAITSKCFCVGALEEEPVYPLAEFVKPYQNFYTEDASNIGLVKDEATGTYVWKNSKLEVNYTSWAEDQKFDENYSFVATTANGWIFTEFLRDKSIYEVETKVSEPSIKLNRSNWYHTEIEIDNSHWMKRQPNSEYLIYCFANRCNDYSIFRWKPTFVEGKLTLSVDGGRFDELWCEGFRYSDLQKVRSNTISNILKTKFIAMFQVQYPEGIYPLGNNMIRFLQEVLNSSKELESYDSRVTKIEDLNEENRTVLVNVEICSKYVHADDFNKDYNSIQNILKSKQRTKKELLELRNYKYCPGRQCGILSRGLNRNFWQWASPKQYCFKSDKTCLPTWCIRKNFVDGAQWEEVEDCNIPEKSQVTMHFFNILKNETLCKTMEISHIHEQINSFDIYLLTDVIDNCRRYFIKYISVYLNIYDSIIKVNKSILEKSEKEMGATTRLLRRFYWMEYRDNQEISVVKDNIIETRLFLKNKTGAVLLKKGNEFEGQELTEEALEKIIAIENFESAIWLTPQLRSMISQTYVVCFTFFLSNALFVERAASPKNIEKVFLLRFVRTYSSDLKGHIWYVQRVSDESPRSCVFWNDADGGGYWETDVEVEKINSGFVVCKFPPIRVYKYLAIATYKLTNRLHDLRQCDTCSVSDTMKKLLNCSKEHGDFSSVDVHLTAQILEKIRGDANINLTELADVVSNLEQVESSVLEEAQQKNGSIDRILQNIDDILKNHNYHSPLKVTKGNFTIVITKLQDIDFCDLVISSKEIRFQKNCESLESHQEDDRFEAALHLDEKLKAQINKNSTIITTVFKNDVLFRSKASKYTTVGKIFGVMIPDIGNYSGPISIFHKVFSGKPTKCVHWKHNKTTNGFWKTDVEVEKINSNYIVCNFLASSEYYTIATSNLTDSLRSVEECDTCSVSDTMEHLLNSSKEHEKFSPVDVHLTAQILEKISGDANVNLTELADVVSNLEQVESSVLEEAQHKNGSTDKILQNIDEILKNYNYHSSLRITKGNFTIGITKPQDMEFRNLVISSKDIQFKENGESLESYQEDDKFEAALHLDEKLKTQIKKNSTIITTVFKNDVLFPSNASKYTTVGKIFGVVLPDIEKFSGPISIFHKVSSGKPAKCVHWKYSQTTNGFWVSDGKARHKSGLVECQFWQAGHFGLLIDRFVEDTVLDYITVINCSLSLFGLLCIVITAIVFKRWRSQPGNQILVNFVVAMILQIVVFFFSSGLFAGSYYFCTAIGAVLHYSVISEFCWMSIIAYLQYKRFVEVLGAPPEKILWKACICGWGLPVVPVVLVLVFGSYVDGNHRLCYPFGRSLYFGVWLPVSVVLTINFGIFCYIMGNVVGKKSPRRHSKGKESIFHWRLGILLFFMLGLTWIFGFLAELHTEVFVYLFCATATLQGFILFLFFIVLNAKTRKLYYTRTVVYHVNKK